MKSYSSHFCHTGAAVLRQCFRVHYSSCLKSCHQSDPDSSWNCPILFPVRKAPGHLSHVLCLSRQSQLLPHPKSPQKHVVFVLLSQVSPRFSRLGCDLVLLWDLPQQSVTQVPPWQCPASEAAELFTIKPVLSWADGAKMRSWLSYLFLETGEESKGNYFLIFFFYMLQCRMSLSGWRQLCQHCHTSGLREAICDWTGRKSRPAYKRVSRNYSWGICATLPPAAEITAWNCD